MMVNEMQDRVSGDILKPLLKKLCKRGEDAQLKRVLSNHYEVEIADALERLKPKHQNKVLRMLDHERATEVVSYLEGETLVGLLKSLSEDDLKPILNRLDADDRTYLFESADAVSVQNWMQLLAEEDRKEAESLLSYPEDSVGRLMTTGFLAIDPDWTVQDTLNYIRRHGEAAETLHTLYVVDKDGVLLDEITLRQMVMAQPSTRIESLMDHNVIKLEAGQNRETAARIMSKFDRPVLPVVDDGNVLVGIVTFDDVIDVVQEAATEDIQKMGGQEALDVPFLQASVGYLFRKRFVWLLVLFLGQMLTVTAMGAFGDQLHKAVILAIFVPLIIASGGNSGSQATSMVVRALALRDVGLGDWWRVLKREVVTGFWLGTVLGIVGLCRVVLGQMLGMDPATNYVLSVALAVGTAMVAVVLFGSLMGSMLPFILSRLGLDPATSSGPFVATLVDVTGLLIYFQTAMIMLRGTALAEGSVDVITSLGGIYRFFGQAAGFVFG